MQAEIPGAGAQMPRGSSQRKVAVPGADRDGPEDARRRAAVRGRVIVAPLRPAVARKRRAGAALVHLQLPGAGAVRGRVVVAVSRARVAPEARAVAARAPLRPARHRAHRAPAKQGRLIGAALRASLAVEGGAVVAGVPLQRAVPRARLPVRSPLRASVAVKESALPALVLL